MEERIAAQATATPAAILAAPAQVHWGGATWRDGHENRVTDIDEDLKNGIAGTERVARQKTLFTIGSFVLLIGSIAALLRF